VERVVEIPVIGFVDALDQRLGITGGVEKVAFEAIERLD
jgi:hypothetical protein